MFENIFSRDDSFAKRKEKIKQLIDERKEDAISSDEFDNLSDELNVLQEKITQNIHTEVEFKRADEIKNIIDKATVSIETIPEFRFAMEYIGFPADDLLDTLQHENAHANKLDSLGGVHDDYKVVFLRDSQGRLVVQPRAGLYIPDEWERNRQIATEIEITRAPEEYGNTLSESDKKYLDKYEK